MSYPRYRLARAHKWRKRTSGDLVLAASTAWANVDTGLDIALAAQIDDVLVATVMAVTNNAAVDLYLDAVTLTAAPAPLNSFARGAAVEASPGSAGVPGWFSRASAYEKVTGAMPYTVVAGDLPTGNVVTVRLRYAMASATARTIYASATYPLVFFVENIGPQDPN